MLYVVLFALGVLILEYYLAKHVIAGLIIPLTSAMALIMALLAMVMTDPRAGDTADAGFFSRALLLFLFLTASSFFLYARKRRQEHRAGYLEEEAVFPEREAGGEEDQPGP